MAAKQAVRTTVPLKASGDFIAFRDDDCEHEPDYLGRIKECFLERPIDRFGGRVLLFDPNKAAITIQLRTDRSADLTELMTQDP